MNTDRASTARRAVLELRVHGVSNTPPAQMLGVDQVTLVAGDETTGFYRAAAGPTGSGDAVAGNGGAAEVVTEAYSWGQLTSGGQRVLEAVQRGLWMLLVPFTFANAAFHAWPPGGPGRNLLPAVGRWLSRVFCLSMTVTLVLAAVGVAVDEVGWQCQDATCLARIPGSWEFLASGWWAHGGRPLAVGLLLPVVVIGVVFLVARRTFHYEAELPGVTLRTDPALDNPLADAAFWDGQRQVRRLAMLHVSVGLVVAAIAALGATRPLSDRAALGAVASVLLVALVGASAVVLVATLALLGRSYVASRRLSDKGKFDRWYGWGPPLLAVFVLAGTVGYLLGLVPGDRPKPVGVFGSMPGYERTLAWLVLGQLLLLVLLAGLARAGWYGALALLPPFAGVAFIEGYEWRGAGVFLVIAGTLLVAVLYVLVSPPRAVVATTATTSDGMPAGWPAWRGQAPALLAGLGWVAGLAFSAGVLFWVADRLGGGSTPTGRSAVRPPPVLMWAGLGVFVATVVLVVVAVIVLATLLRHHRTDDIMAGYPTARASLHAQQRAASVATAQAIHDFMQRRGLTVLGWLVVAGGAIAIAGVAGGVTAMTPMALFHSTGVVKWMVDVGSALAALLPVGLVVLGYLMHRRPKVRRTVGILWDIGSFWPRAAHPLAPPCYAERAVPQLVTRIAGLLDAPPSGGTGVRAVILAGHSQGSCIAAATALQLPARYRPRLHLFTYGSQLTALFGRIFPDYFGPDRLTALARELSDEGHTRWDNFWRGTDPLGYEIAAGGYRLNRPVRDPTALVPCDGEVLDPPIRGHSGYPVAAEYAEVRATAVAQLPE